MSWLSARTVFAAAVLLTAQTLRAQAAVGDKLDLAGLIQLPSEDWSNFPGSVLTPTTPTSASFMWRSSWAAAGDAQPTTVNQSVNGAQVFGKTNSQVVMDGPTAPTALGYNPFSVVTHPDGSKALRITPQLVPAAQQASVWGYPVVSGELSTAGRNAYNVPTLETYAANYSVTIYHQVRLPTEMWAALWEYSKSDYGGQDVTEMDLVETIKAGWPSIATLTQHSSDSTWLSNIAAGVLSGLYPAHAAGPQSYFGSQAAGYQYAGLAGTDPHALHDWAQVVGPKVTQWAIDGVVVLEFPTPSDVAGKYFHEIIDLDLGTDITTVTSASQLDYMEVGRIDRYVYPGTSKVHWMQQDVGDGSGVSGAVLTSGTNFQLAAATATTTTTTAATTTTATTTTTTPTTTSTAATTTAAAAPTATTASTSGSGGSSSSIGLVAGGLAALVGVAGLAFLLTRPRPTAMS
jgi:hypothetical protein